MKLINEIMYVNCDKDNTIIINLINGLADVIDRNLETKLKNNKFEDIQPDIIECLISRNFLFWTKDEYINYLKHIETKVNEYEIKECPNYVFIPTYDCNLQCSYCYQKANFIQRNVELDQCVDEFFKFISEQTRKLEIENHSKYRNDEIVITLMGGEPLLIENRELIKKFVYKCRDSGYMYNIVTNGLTIKEYNEIINTPNLTSVQLTLDGNMQTHDSRRMRKNGDGTYHIIKNSIKLLLDSNINVDLRINVDKDNIFKLPSLAHEIQQFFNYPNFNPYIFLLEDEGCMGKKNVMVDYEALSLIYELAKKHKVLKQINVAYIGRELVESIFDDVPFYPALRKCASSKNQYLFDLYGGIYKCWWGIGLSHHKINPDNSLLLDSLWKLRKISMIKKCRLCKFRYLCGGGCVGRMINNSFTVSSQGGQCHDFEKLLNAAIKENYHERIKADEIHDFYTT